MKFDAILNILYGEITDKTNTLLLSSSPVLDCLNNPDLLIHTGFITQRDSHYPVEILYDPLEGIICHQILNRNTGYFLRHIGLHMFKSENDYYTPFNTDAINGKVVTVKYFNGFFESSLNQIAEINCDFSGLRPNFRNHNSLNDFDVSLDFSSFNASHGLIIDKVLGNKFVVSFELGNEIIVLHEFPLRRYYQYYPWENDKLKDFFLPAKDKSTKKVGTPSWNKLADDHLKNLDEDFPGWSSGIWD